MQNANYITRLNFTGINLDIVHLSTNWVTEPNSLRVWIFIKNERPLDSILKNFHCFIITPKTLRITNLPSNCVIKIYECCSLPPHYIIRSKRFEWRSIAKVAPSWSVSHLSQKQMALFEKIRTCPFWICCFTQYCHHHCC